MKNYIIFLLITLFFAACGNDEDNDKTSENKEAVDKADAELLQKAKQIFAILPKVAENPDNVVTDAKVKLGKILFFDNRLSFKETQSCNTCHNLSTFGVDNLPTSPGDNSGLGTRNSPAVFNSAIQRVQFWDGRAKDVEEQAGMPITNPVEMAMPDEEFVINRLAAAEGYKKLFAAAFPEEEPLTYDNLKKAIGAFERTLMTTDKFDKFLGGDIAAFSEQEKKGLKTFIDKGCTACHSGADLGGNLMMKFGIHKDYTEVIKNSTVDKGLYELTKDDKDMFVFRTSALRNVAKTAPYFHNGSVKDLKEAVKVMAVTELGQEFTEEETDDIVAFLNTLTGDVNEDVKNVPDLP